MVPVSTRSRRRKRILATAVSALACAALIGGCSRPISGTPTTLGGYSTTEVAGLPATNGPSGPKEDAPSSSLPVEGTDNGAMDKLARDAVADIDEFWTKTFPKAFPGKRFEPVKRLVSYDSGGPGLQLCGQNTAGVVNAFYCPPEDSIAWDRGTLLPELNNSFGPMAVVTVLAHEIGHAVQHRASTATSNDQVIVLEQQADCFTGAYFRHVAEGSSKYFQVSTGQGLNEVMGVLNFIRDAPGDADFRDGNAHGSAFDRVTAFQFGFSEGPQRCAKMDFNDVQRRTTLFQAWKPIQKENANLPVDQQSLDAVEKSLRTVFRDTGAEPPKIVAGLKPCGSQEATSPASYCPSTNTISLDMAALQKIGQPPSKNADSTGYGDFAAYAQVASRYALSVQKATGLPLDDEAAGLRTACMVGSWSGLLVEDPFGQRNPVGSLRIAPDDIDEGVSALLGEDSLIAANVNGDQVPVGFARVEAFRVGVQEGFAPCSTKYGA
ncbi:Predicted metalloprotease [Saccharopolyspora shandongensis]|uniref:Predicted metalloprotease n=1 Tax=Saccharopolyspora shandongensis TaxID=418495 RepID=A0A1H2W0Q8_9PSEU|nr:neutral zinc metallopeptidase [Saccharopolyspora shandongensis]SDW74252.1 Predicted metalloprotease [Saccharopolyspora shandongensis]